MTKFLIGIEIGHLIPPGAALNAETFPALAEAVAITTKEVETQWLKYAGGEPLPNGEKITPRSGNYQKSIQLRMLGPFAGEVFSELPYAEQIEKGTPRYDMKQMLHTSLKVRISKKGKRYLIIPFNHGTPGAVTFHSVMKPDVFDLAKKLFPSRVVGTRQVPNARGVRDVHTGRVKTVLRRRYRWGDRLSEDALRAKGVSGKRLQRSKGMVHFQEPSGGHGKYMTFRVMSESSTGWVRKPVEGKWPAKTTADLYRPIAEDLFEKAVERDFERHVRGEL